MKRKANIKSPFIELCSVSCWQGYTAYDIAVRVMELLKTEGIDSTSHGSRAALILVRKQDIPRAKEILIRDAQEKQYQISWW